MNNEDEIVGSDLYPKKEREILGDVKNIIIKAK